MYGFFSIAQFLSNIVIFALIGRLTISGVNTGDIRSNLGGFGILTTWNVQFLTPALLTLNYLSYNSTNKNYHIKSIYYINWILSIFIAIFTGYKSAIAMMVLPTLTIILLGKSIPWKFFIYIPLLLFVITLSTSMIKGLNLNDAYLFALHRSTVMTAFGTIGVWNVYPEGAPLNKSIMLTFGLFGNNIASALTGLHENSIDFLDTNLSRLITYKVYPNASGALNNTVNVTVTNFGEAFYMLGKYYIIYAIFAGIISGVIIKNFKRKILIGNYNQAICYLIYFLLVILPWFNSGNIFKLISLPTIIWMICTFTVIHIILHNKPFKR